MANLESNTALILPADSPAPCPNCGRSTPGAEDPVPVAPVFNSDADELTYLREKVTEIPLLQDQIKGLMFFKDQVEELQLLKDQVQDVARVCNAVARGDLSQKITVVVQGVVMVQLKDVINTMVDKLGQFAKEVTRVSQEVGTEGYVFLASHGGYLSSYIRKLGGQALVLDVEGTWRELTGVVNKLAANLTNQVCYYAFITSYPS